MSGAAGFHRSAFDNSRSYAGSRTLGHDNSRSAMSEILGAPTAPAQPPPARPQSEVANILGGVSTAEPAVRSPRAPKSAMDDVMQGIAVLDPARGPRPVAKYNSGSSVLSALRPEASDADNTGGDPFAHMRTRPKAAAGGHGRPADSRPAAQEEKRDPFVEALAGVHRELCALAQATPRHPTTGALEDYHSLLGLLAARGLPLGSHAGTLIAHFDVHGSISYDEFVQLVWAGLQETEEAAAAPAAAAPAMPPGGALRPLEPAQQQPPAPRVAPSQQKMGAYDPSQWTMMPALAAAKPKNAKMLLGGGTSANAATNMDLARALNGGLGQHARRTADAEYSVTAGRSNQLR